LTTLVALACAAPASAATNVYWRVAWGNGRIVEINVDTAPGEANNLEIFAEPETPGKPEVVIVRDAAGVSTISASSGDCVATPVCTEPCQIRTPTEARCALADGFAYKEPIDERLIQENYVPPGPLNPGGTATYRPNPENFTHIFVPMKDGADRLTTPAHAGTVPPRVTAADGGDTYDLGSELDFRALDGDRVTLRSDTPVLSGLTVKLRGNAEVFAANDRSDSIQCEGTGMDLSRIHVDQFDGVRCESWSQDPLLPIRPVDPG
jgi:hypothetical protein